MLRSLLLAAITVLLFSPHTRAQSGVTACGYQDYEVIIDVANGDAMLRVNVYTPDQTPGDTPRWTGLVEAGTRNGCGLLIETNDAGVTGSVPAGIDDWRFGDPDTQPELRLLTVEFIDETILSAPVLIDRFTYNVCNTTDKIDGFGFYCSRTGYGSPSDDIRFRYDVGRGKILVQPDGLKNLAGASLAGVSDYFPGYEDEWILPYNMDALCAALPSCPPSYNRKDVFVSPVHGDPATGSFITPQYREWTFAPYDVVVPADASGTYGAGMFPRKFVWDQPDPIRFQPNHRLVVEGEMDILDTSLEPADAAQGWHGILADGADADLTLDGATLDGVVYPTPPNPNAQFPPYAALTATDSATVSVQGLSAIQNSVNANGVVAALSGTSVSISGASEVKNNPHGLGVLASAGATVELSGINTFVRENGLGGVFATGSGSEIDILPGASVEDNDGAYGATANVSGTIQLLTPASSPSLTGTTGNPTVQNNTGGLDTRTSAYVYTGQNGVTGCSPGTASVSLNNLSDEDARANSASIITAECTYWNGRTSQAQLDLTSGGTSSITVAPLSATLSLTGGTSSFKSAGGSASARDGEALPAAEARRLAASGDASAASALLSETLLTETDADTRTALLSAAVYVAARGLSPLLRAQLATTAAGGGAESDWARHALAVDAMQRGAEDAWARAEALSRVAGHRAAGHTLMLRQAMATETGARDALAAFAAIPERDADEEEALTAALAVVAAAYPDVDLAAALRDGGAPITEAKTGTAPAAATLAAYPNPSAGAARVALALAEAAEATVAVYDALGRRVATLHQGALDAGDHAFALPGDTLAPGVYVVTAQTAGSGGATHREAVRWTRMR